MHTGALAELSYTACTYLRRSCVAVHYAGMDSTYSTGRSSVAYSPGVPVMSAVHTTVCVLEGAPSTIHTRYEARISVWEHSIRGHRRSRPQRVLAPASRMNIASAKRPAVPRSVHGADLPRYLA
jgi:hypothetical protein